MSLRTVIPLALASVALTGCSGNQAILNAGGPQSGRILNLWWLLVWISIIVYVLVVLFLFAALLRQRKQQPTEASMRRTVTTATAATVITLFIILVASVRTGNALASVPALNAMNIEVKGHQWWWEINYPDFRPDQQVGTANEIHIPVGRPIRLKVTADDVIHSVWIPALAGKIDAIPSRQNMMWLQADKPGLYRGQCAEYCGLQHAHMVLFVVAESPEDFNKWLENQRKPAPTPNNPTLARGQQVFMNSPCVVCHTIRGTGANGQVAPDLTHVSSRQTIAAGTLPNNRGSLGGWITDSQRVKPGNRMPPINIASEDLDPLISYLGSLR